MDITEEAILADTIPADDSPEEDALMRETCPLPWEDTVREFENYLLDIGVRI